MKLQLPEIIKADLIKGFLSSVGRTYLLHESKFLTGGTLLGEFCAIGLVYKNSPLIHEYLDDTRYAIMCVNESDDFPDVKKEKKKTLYSQAIKRLSPLVVPIFIFVGFSSYCAIKNEKNNEKHIAELTAALALAQGTISEYAEFRKEATAALGEKKVEKIDQTVTEKQVEANPPKESEVVQGESGIPLFDPYSNSIIHCSMDRINYACECMSNNLLACDEADLRMYHDIIGVETTALDEAIVWHSYEDGCKISARKRMFTYRGQDVCKIELYPMPKGFERY